MSGGAWFLVYRCFLGVGFVDPRVRFFIALMTRPPCFFAVLSCLKYLGGSNVISPAGLMRMICVPWSAANPSSCCVWCGVILVVMVVTCVTACGLLAYLLSNGINKQAGCRHYAHTLLSEHEHDDSTRTM